MSRYSEACDAGYDGPSPAEERRWRNRNKGHEDCRDPDHKGCELCEESPDPEAETKCPSCGCTFDFPHEWCVCGLPEGQRLQLEDAAAIFLATLRRLERLEASL